MYVTSLEEILWGIFLVAITIAIHGFGMVEIFQFNQRYGALAPSKRFNYFRELGHLLAISALMVVVHLFEVMVWSLFFIWQSLFPNLSVSFYFTLMEYTTVGSDVSLPSDWRLLGGMVAIGGFLAFAWSTSVFVAVAQNFQNRRIKTPTSSIISR